MQTYKSEIDDSVNFVQDYKNGIVESRYVRRDPSYFICYLSSQTGCKMGCQFCHLTTTKQTSFEHVDRHGFIKQAEAVFDYYITQPEAQICNFNFMARGEALANPSLTSTSFIVLGGLKNLVKQYKEDLLCRYNISTIMPKSFDYDLAEIFDKIYPTIYYSFYSVSDEFRQKWMPSAMHYDLALKKLKKYQHVTDKIVKIHGTFIEGENDSWDDVIQLVLALHRHELRVDFNIVRYNPPNELSKESPKLQEIFNYLYQHLNGKVKIVDRVGYDVNASCGMFV